MKYNQIGIILILSLISISKNKDIKKLIIKSIQNQLITYPKSQLRDLYKSFFQDRFGPGHLISNISSADEYLRHELETAKTFKNPYYEYCGYLGNLLRVNLRVLHENLIPYQNYFTAFIKSVNSIKPIPIEEWIKEWEIIRNVIVNDLHLDKSLYNFEEDDNDIKELLKKGEYQMSHSKRFDDEYEPHYRIIEKNIFKNEILPFIEKMK